jgi:hypothetical protein
MFGFASQAQVRPYNYRNAPSAAANSTMNMEENTASGPKQYPYNQAQFGHFIRGPKTGRIPQSPMSSTQVGQYSKPFHGFSGFATEMTDPRRNFYKSQNYNVSRARGEVSMGINNPMSWGYTPQMRAFAVQQEVHGPGFGFGQPQQIPASFGQRAFNPNNYIMSNVKGGKSRKQKKKSKKSKKTTRRH